MHLFGIISRPPCNSSKDDIRPASSAHGNCRTANLVISLETENRSVDDNCSNNRANTSATVDSHFSSLIAEFCSGDLFCSKSRNEKRHFPAPNSDRGQGDHHVRNTSKASFSSRGGRPPRRVAEDNVAAYQLPSNNIHQNQSSCSHFNRGNERVHSIKHSH